MSDSIYAYGIIEAEDEDLEFERTGIDGAERIYTITYGNIAAIVSDIDTTDPERTDENAERHDDVLRTVLEDDGGRTVVPMGFGMAFKNARALKSVLRGARLSFTRALGDVEGMFELGVKVVTEEDATVEAEAVRESVRDELDPVSVNRTENDLFSDRLVVNDAYLVEREEREAFDEAVERVREAHDDVIVRYTGPWAPYNFVDIHVGAKRQ